jgi:hypothetical protein
MLPYFVLLPALPGDPFGIASGADATVRPFAGAQERAAVKARSNCCADLAKQ